LGGFVIVLAATAGFAVLFAAAAFVVAFFASRVETRAASASPAPAE
jgi:biotin transporter BioY